MTYGLCVLFLALFILHRSFTNVDLSYKYFQHFVDSILNFVYFIKKRANWRTRKAGPDWSGRACC